MNEYWTEYWKLHGTQSKDLDRQTQVLRTLNKQPISKEKWQFTLAEIDSQFKVKEGDRVLDLCSGNGLLSRHFASKGALVRAVDISADLLEGLKDETGIEVENADIRNVNYEPESFDHVLLYAGVQYLNLAETVILFQRIHSWLKPGGSVFVGDIPDLDHQFSFYNNPERQAVYFQNLLKGIDVVGTWFRKDWLVNLAAHLGFAKADVVPQNEELIYAKYRFDLKLVK